jgi:hypothetical protein
MADHAARCHPLPPSPQLHDRHDAAGARVPRRETATWYLLDPAEQICLSCALPTRLRNSAACVTPGVAHRLAPRGLATARHTLDMGQVVETHPVVQRQMRQVRPDGTSHTYWDPRIGTTWRSATPGTRRGQAPS